MVAAGGPSPPGTRTGEKRYTKTRGTYPGP
jgi:hypothetical protein